MRPSGSKKINCFLNYTIIKYLEVYFTYQRNCYKCRNIFSSAICTAFTRTHVVTKGKICFECAGRCTFPTVAFIILIEGRQTCYIGYNNITVKSGIRLGSQYIIMDMKRMDVHIYGIRMYRTRLYVCLVITVDNEIPFLT